MGLCVLPGGVLRPPAFFSKNLSPAEARYSVFGRELLAVYLAIPHFRHFLDGREFVVLTDQKPLVGALRVSPDRYSPCEIRHLDFISQFSCDIQHIHKFRCPSSTQAGTITCDISTGHDCPFVPAAMCRQVFDSLHGLFHPGVRATVKLITDRFHWPQINRDVRRWVRSCSPCQRAKIHRHTVTSPALTPSSRPYNLRNSSLIIPPPASSASKRSLFSLPDILSSGITFQ
nr:unnamed protein product [Spirometra erinaceieuropaei]